MSQPKLSQHMLYEVLVSEIESLKKSKKDYNKVCDQINVQLSRLESLYQQPICVDTEAMRSEHEKLKATLRQGLYIPKWLGISFFCLVIGFGISVFFNYKQYVVNKHQHAYIEDAEGYINKLEKDLKAKKRR
jgi:hypothetical protein